MIKIKFIALLISAAALSALSACSYVKTLFPDKEKDYQYTTEIPPLIWPDDLKKATPEVSGVAASAPPPSAQYLQTPRCQRLLIMSPLRKPNQQFRRKTNRQASPSAPESEPELPNTAITVERIKLNDGENRLSINVPFTKHGA